MRIKSNQIIESESQRAHKDLSVCISENQSPQRIRTNRRQAEGERWQRQTMMDYLTYPCIYLSLSKYRSMREAGKALWSYRATASRSYGWSRGLSAGRMSWDLESELFAYKLQNHAYVYMYKVSIHMCSTQWDLLGMNLGQRRPPYPSEPKQ